MMRLTIAVLNVANALVGNEISGRRQYTRYPRRAAATCYTLSILYLTTHYVLILLVALLRTAPILLSYEENE